VHRPDDKQYLDPVKAHVKMWAEWRNSDLPPDLGFPHQSAEQSDMNHASAALPGWVIELTMDNLIMCAIRRELRRALLAVHGVAVREDEARDAGVVLKRMTFSRRANKYHWPTEMEKAAHAAGMKKRTLYSQYNQALYWIDGRLS